MKSKGMKMGGMMKSKGMKKGGMMKSKGYKKGGMMKSKGMKMGGMMKSKGYKKGKAWAKRTFDTYPSAYANMAASKYCKDPNYGKKSKAKKMKNGGLVNIKGQGIVMRERLR